MIKAIAIYLPQFHPIPENDRAWGKGFTEWTNVKKAKPLFRGHYQPQLPADLGFYDLRQAEVREKQAKLAADHGIYGFCYYHYWFNGKRLLHEPFDAILQSKTPDFPFCLFWANETWSRRWLGEEKDIIIKQTYSQEDDYVHIRWLIEAFRDPRYIKINNRPLFLIYRPNNFPDISKTLKIFREECVKQGIENPYLVASNSHAGKTDLRKSGFDAMLNFEPQLGVLPYFMDDRQMFKKLVNNLKMGIPSARLKVYDYDDAHRRMQDRSFSYPYFPCTFVNWDNSPRRGKNGIIIRNSTPDKFQYYLERSFAKLKEMNLPDSENFAFINAWNEWAEGNYLEPDKQFKSSYLIAVKKALENFE
jgi:lipopolysaccharide biosynthesis protein